ncbi:AAA domain protein [Mycobacterium xenopi 3993]|nr:AAA domain protein [Mycobacterium xenopi 3993]
MLTSTPAVELPALERLFPAGFEEQRQAAKLALSQQVTVLTGGPAPARPPPSHGCSRCWPSRPKPLGVAAADRVGGTDRQGGGAAAGGGGGGARQARCGRPGAAGRAAGDDAASAARLEARTSSRFKHDRGNRLPHDVIVVDETSMVSLTLMARLLEAVRPQARLILVGDADQLASVEAGRCWPIWWTGCRRAPMWRLRRCGLRTDSANRSGRWPTRSGSATPSVPWRCCGRATSISSSSRIPTRPSDCGPSWCRTRFGCGRLRL